jgi:hypothetical protein
VAADLGCVVGISEVEKDEDQGLDRFWLIVLGSFLLKLQGCGCNPYFLGGLSIIVPTDTFNAGSSGSF